MQSQPDDELLVDLKGGLENSVTFLPLNKEIEDRVIALRQSRKIKLPDAIISATSLCFGIKLKNELIGLAA
jgi:hypothetical protein